VLAASIGSGASLLASANSESTTIVTGSISLLFFIFAGVAFVSGCPVGFVYPTFFHTWTQEMDILESELGLGEPMIIDSEQLEGNTVHASGLAFPHIVGEDGQHTVQHIDM
jgi:hypothetical protein